jgi:sugar/nucleoside kinase (ribokinase family)
MNESEAIWFSGRPRFRGEVKRKDDEHLVKALEKYQEVLDKYPDKTLVVTAGAVGAFIIRKDFDTFTPGIDIKQIVNKAGAGDCAAAMAIYELLINNKTITPDVVNDAADLLVRGCTIKIQCPDTQVDMSLMRDLLKGKTPTQGVVDIVVPKQVEKQRA